MRAIRHRAALRERALGLGLGLWFRLWLWLWLRHTNSVGRVVPAAALASSGVVRASGAMPFESPQYDMEEKLAFFREFGYVIFEQLFDPDLLDQVDENMRPLIDTIVNRERPITTTYTVTEDDVIGEHVPAVMKWDGTERALYVPADAVPGTVLDIPNDIAHRGDVQTGHGRLTETHRYNLNLPWREPFAHPHFYENPRVLDFLERYWESDRFSLTTLYVNIPGPGTRYQRWHRDGGADFYDFPAFVERPDPLTKFISKGWV